MPLKHKEKNKNKFIPFSERITNTNVDVIHRIGHRNEEENISESESYFHATLQKWNDLNCSSGWKEFSKEVKGVQSLAQVLFLKKQIVSTLLSHLEKKDPLTLQAILEMVVALARDLRKEFYEFYPDTISRIVDLLSSKDIEVLEWSFQCLAYLFKFLWRCMTRSIEQVLTSLLPLLSPKRPDYIHFFAADSFAFLARKVKDQTSFVSLILNHLKSHPEDAKGCGRLVFAWMRGIKGQLHSSSQNLLVLMFGLLASESLPSGLLESLLSHTLTYLAVEIRPGGLTYVWGAIQTTLSEFSSIKNTNWEVILRVLRLAHQLCSHCQAVHLTLPHQFIEKLLPLLRKDALPPESILSEIASIVASLLLSPSVSLSQQHAVKLTTEVMEFPSPQIILSFVEKLVHWGSFEVLILPRLLTLVKKSFCQNSVCVMELKILAQLVHCKAPPVCTAADLPLMQDFELDFSIVCGKNNIPSEIVSQRILALLNDGKKDEKSGSLLNISEEIIYSVIILPHIKSIKRNEALKVLQKYVKYTCEQMALLLQSSEYDGEQNTEICAEDKISRFLCLFFVLLEAVIRIKRTDQSLDEVMDFDLVVQTLLPLACQGSCRLSALRALDICLASMNLIKIPNKSEIFRKIYNSLKLNLSAPHHLVREMTCRVLSQLPLAEELHTIFVHCLEAEIKGATITDYRDKLVSLRKLSYELTHQSFIENKDYEMAPLYLILGSFYVNFQLLWEPLHSLVASFAAGMPASDFWPVYHAQLILATRNRDLPSDNGTVVDLSFECTFINNYFSSLNAVDDKPDYAHYRLLLWQTAQYFPEVCEKRNRDVVSLFLAFMEDEYYRSDAEAAKSLNIRKHDISMCDNNAEEKMAELEEEDDEEMECDENQDESANVRKHKFSRGKILFKGKKLNEVLSARLVTKTLYAQLGLLSKMRNPRSMHRESDLSGVYHDFLSHKNPTIQKAALGCIMNYKHKYLTPYSQHLFALIDSKSYKAEMSAFCINKDSETILKEHRPDLIPIIMKIVYSKMTAKTGMRTGGKGEAGLRRSLVLRFLAGCHEDEMLQFITMAFHSYSHLLKDDLDAMTKSIQSSMDLEKVIPPRRLQSSVNLLAVVQEQFGGLMGNELLKLILRVLVCVGSTVKSVLEQRENVYVGYHNAFRLLRSSCLEVLTQFFSRFEVYPWTASEIDTVLDVFVWPVIDRLPFEGVFSPTALMKLLNVWSQNPRYFILFSAHAPASASVTPLPALMSLLLNTKTHPSVCGVVMEMLENLLTLRDHGHSDDNDMEVDDLNSERAPAIPVSNVLAVNEDVISQMGLSETPNLGSKLIFPHIPSILERLRVRLAISSNRGSGLNKRELLVLTAVSEFVRAPETSATLAQLLLPILSRRSAAPCEDEEPVLKMMKTLCHLLGNVSDPHTYLRPLAPLFSCINGVAGRKMLVSLVKVVSEACSLKGEDGVNTELNLLAGVVCKLNAFDARWVEQPDFDKRLEGFKEVQALLNCGKLSLELGVIVIYHCFYTVRVEKDLSLRDFAAHCLRLVGPALSLQLRGDGVVCRYLVDSTILPLIRSAICKTKAEGLQSEAVLLLGEMTRLCSDLHPVLKDLHPLSNKEDLEVDFFENLQHLQLHRKTRALLKICEVLNCSERTPNPRTLTQFILPLAAQFLCSEKFSGKNSLVDAAISVVGVVCRHLPWHQYEAVLRYYLGRLRVGALFQKQLVRIIVIILDSFHFDLSRADTAVLRKYGGNILDGEEKDNDNKSKATQNSEIVGMNGESTPPTEGKETENGDGDLEDLEQQLNSTEQEEEADPDMVEESEKEKTVLAIDKQIILNRSAATRAIRTITAGFLPQLNRALTARTVLENSHKVNKKQVQNSSHNRDAEEEELLRVPMALAVVKLLQRLPEGMFSHSLPGIFSKLCTFLKSRLDSVRHVARDTLRNVMVSLGPSYLASLLDEMTTLLTRGFQVHVLVFCIHSVLIALKEKFSVGDIDSCIRNIIDVCKSDVFGSVAEEREEGKIASKVHEARSSKSYDILNMLSQFASESYLTNIVIPFKEIVQNAHSHKTVNKASECLRHIVLGLSDNKFVAPSSLVVFAYGVASESIPSLSLKHKKKTSTEDRKLEARLRRDCFIIPEAPKHHIGIKTTDAARVAARMNAHLFVDFGLRLIYSLLKREKLKEVGDDVRPLLDPVVPLLNQCLSSQHIKLCILSLQCLTWLLRVDLPSLRKHIPDVTSSIFGLLHKYAAAGLSQGDNFDLVVAAFKAVAVLVRDVKYYTLEKDQLKALLLYAEQDLADINKHATAFALLKAILSRKLIAPEIHEVMNRVATLSITSEVSYVRQQARSVFHQFLMDYPLGGKMSKHLTFFLSQLNFEVQAGRESALEIVNSIITSFPLSKLSEQCELFYLMLGARLVNDDSPDCRKMVAQIITKMLLRLEKSERDRLYNMSQMWFRDEQVSHRQLASQLCGLFVETEKKSFKGRLSVLLPIVLVQFSAVDKNDGDQPGQHVRFATKAIDKEPESDKSKDHHLYQVVQLVLKICIHCPDWLLDPGFNDHVCNLTEHASVLLAHPHEWVRLGAVQILTHILSTVDVQAISRVANDQKSVSSEELGFFGMDTKVKLKSMILDHCAQLKPGVDIEQQLLFQVVKNLVILADMVKDITAVDDDKATRTESNEHISDTKEGRVAPSLPWLVRRMRRIVNAEVAEAPKSTVMRTMVLNWTAAVVVKLDGKYIRPVLHDLLAPIVRERSSDELAPEGSPIAQLRSLSKEVGGLIKNAVGVECFVETQARLQQLLTVKRAERKKILKQEAVTEPEKAAKRKAQKHVQKRAAKKMRIMKMRGKKTKRKSEFSVDDV